MIPEFRSELDLEYKRLFIRSFHQKFDVPMGWRTLISHTIQQIDEGISDQDAETFKWIELTESRGHLLMMAKYSTVQSESGTFCKAHHKSIKRRSTED